MRPSLVKRTFSKVAEVQKEPSRHISFLKSRMDIGGGDMDWLRGKVLLKPEDQLILSDAELQEEIARVLTIRNTRVPDSLVEWSWKLKSFILLPPPPHLITVLSVPGSLLHKDSEEARIQLAGGLVVDIPFEEDILHDDEEEREEEEEEEDEEEEADVEEQEVKDNFKISIFKIQNFGKILKILKNMNLNLTMKMIMKKNE